MTTESQGFDPYEAVLADLRAKRDQIDQTIKMLEAQRGGGSVTGLGSGQNTGAAPNEGPGVYLGMSIADATKKLLQNRKQQLGNAEILAGLKAGGLVLRSENPINVIGSVLTRRFNEDGDIVRVGRGIWGLKEWYPGRSFKTKADNGDKGEAESPKEPTLLEKLEAKKAARVAEKEAAKAKWYMKPKAGSTES